MITGELLKTMPPHTIFAKGEILNGPGLGKIYMTNSNIGKSLDWVAIRGKIHDWSIYCEWSNKHMSAEEISKYGQKVPLTLVERLLKMDKEASEFYRH